MNKNKIYHPLIFGIIPAGSLYANNYGLVRFNDFIQTVMLMLVISVITWFIVHLIIQDIHKSAFMTSILLLLFYSFGHVFRTAHFILTWTGIGDSNWLMHDSSQNWLMVFFVGLVGFVIILIKKTEIDFLKITHFFQIFSVLLIIVTISNFFLINRQLTSNPTHKFSNLWQQNALDELQRMEIANVGAHLPSRNYPDIYYIILDGYGRQDVLLYLYDLDLSDFFLFLSNAGFFVAAESTSNYNFTLLSLSSALNFMYLDPVVDIVGADSGYTLPLELILEDSRLFRHLRESGYQIIAFNSGYDATKLMTADHYLTPDNYQMNAFHGQLLSNTPLPMLLKLFFMKDQYDLHRDNILFTLENLPKTITIDGPKFVFAHIVAPHPPFVFDRQGEAINPARPFSLSDGDVLILGEGQQDYHSHYRDQTLYITDQVRKIIIQLLENSTIPPIIIVQSDHGPGSQLSYSGPDQSNLYERMSILNAYYFPDGDYRLFYDTITPVNSFRIILDMYFGTNYGLIEDLNYFVRGDQLYKFADVTDQIEPHPENE